MSSLTSSIAIDAAKDKVWEVLADFGSVSQHQPNITDSAIVSDADTGVGAVRTCEHMKMGTLVNTIVAWTEGEAYSYDVTAGMPFPMKALRTPLASAYFLPGTPAARRLVPATTRYPSCRRRTKCAS